MNSGDVRDYDITVAVVGNPNVGKSTLFNVLTGEVAHVANWPGVTVARKEGIRKYRGRRVRFVDLPGIYGLSASSLEEVVTREYVVSGEPDLVVVLADSTAPERTLYLPIQLLELTPNVILVFTKVDEMGKLGIHIHFDKLESILGIPVIPTSALKGVGIRELLDKIVEFSDGRRFRSEALKLDYGGLEPFIAEVTEILRGSKAVGNYPIRWVAVRLLEGDYRLEELLTSAGESHILKKVQQVREAVKRSVGRDPAELLIAARFNYIQSITRDVIVRVERRRGIEVALEELLHKPVIGSLVSILMLFTALLVVFSVNTGFPLNIVLRYVGLTNLADLVESYSISGLLSMAFNLLTNLAGDYLSHINPILASLVADGVIAGVGAVLSFLPLILMVFVFLALLEDSGIAPRIAISFHNILSKFGFSGRAIYPLIISIGCNVPGVLASRTAVEEEERLEIIVSTPFIPCQARLVVAMALVTTFLKSPIAQAVALISVYLIGVAIFLLTGLLTRLILFRKSEPPELILEIPTIHKPSPRVVWWISWDYTKHFLKKAGIVILSLSIIIWFLLNLGPTGLVTDFKYSFGGILGNLIAPVLAPFDIWGENAWKVGFALIHGFIAKESLLESLVLLQGGEVDVANALQSLELSVMQAYSILLLTMLYVPCLATTAVIYQESRSFKVTLAQVIYMLVVAYTISLTTYQLMKAVASWL